LDLTKPQARDSQDATSSGSFAGATISDFAGALFFIWTLQGLCTQEQRLLCWCSIFYFHLITQMQKRLQFFSYSMWKYKNKVCS